MAARRDASPKSSAESEHWQHLHASIPGWALRTQETYTTLTNDGLVCVVSHVSYTDMVSGQTSHADWHGVVTNDRGMSLMESTDPNRDAVMTAVAEFLDALSVARERDPVT